MTLSKEQLQILQHALGVDQYGRGRMYRSHFCAGGSDEAVCRSLVELGYMYVFASNDPTIPYYNCAVTETGKRAMIEASPAPPKLTRSQKRYQRFLRADGLFDSFKAFLKWEASDESRNQIV